MGNSDPIRKLKLINNNTSVPRCRIHTKQASSRIAKHEVDFRRVQGANMPVHVDGRRQVGRIREVDVSVRGHVDVISINDSRLQQVRCPLCNNSNLFTTLSVR